MRNYIGNSQTRQLDILKGMHKHDVWVNVLVKEGADFQTGFFAPSTFIWRII